MTDILHASSDLIDAALLRAMYRERKRVFVDLLGWDIPVREGQYEIDQFDGPATRYIIIADPEGNHRGSMRLLASDGPHVLGSIFPQLCAGPVPVSPRIWEISRFCLSRSLRAAERRIVRDQLVTACVRFAATQDIGAYSCVASLGWLRQIPAFGWRCVPLGVPVALESGLTGAMLIHIEADTPQRMAAAGHWAPARDARERIAA